MGEREERREGGGLCFLIQVAAGLCIVFLALQWGKP